MNSKMSPGERVVRCLCGEPVDRVPFGVGLGWYPWGETLENWRRQAGRPDLDPAREFGYDASFALPALDSGIRPPYEHKVIAETADTVTWRDGRGVTQRGRKDGHSMPEFLDYPVKTPDDWERLKTERLRIGDPGRVHEDWKAFRARLKANGEVVQVGTFPWGVFGAARDLLGVETLLTAFYDTPDMIHDMMGHLTRLWISLWEQVADQVPIDHIHIWEDMSGKQGSLISPAMVEEFMMPCYDRIVEFGRSAGVRVISVDTDGNCSELVPIMMKHGVTMFFPFEVQAGNDVREYRRRYPALGIVGGLDKRVLAGTKADVDREVEKAVWMIRNGGRYLPGFDHLIPPDASWENFRYAAGRIRDLCHEPQQTGGR